MTFASETIEFRKQVFFLILTELLRDNPDRDLAHLVHRATEAARLASPAAFDPDFFMRGGASYDSE